MGLCFNPQELSDFARYYGFHYDSLEPTALVKEILADMERGLSGLASSQPMIPSYITPTTQALPGKTVLALDAGGTNLRASLVRFDGQGRATAEGTAVHPMPGTKGRLNASQFFQAIADAALPLLAATPDIDGIGFTFSYHIDIQPNADGILIAFSKEVDAPDVIGKAVGVGLREALAHKGFAYDGPIVLLNDTVATLLAGLTAIPTDGAGNLAEGPVAGLILGTGFNTAYPETSIPKIGFATKDAPQIVVAESGTYNFRHRGPLDAEFDRTTKSPGTYTLEKATSGAYIGPLTLHILKRAIADKVIRFRKSEECLAMPHLETKAFNEFANAPFATQNPFAALFGADEKETVSAVLHLSSILVERGAVLGAAVLAATAQRMRMGYKPDSPMRIAVEGTTFLRYKGMRRALESRLHTLLTKDDPVSYTIEPVDQASLYGAAVAAASRRNEP